MFRNVARASRPPARAIITFFLVACSVGIAEDNAMVEKRLAQAHAALAQQIAEFRQTISGAVHGRTGLTDRQLQERSNQVHTLLWDYYYDPRNRMVYTIIEPHTGQVVFPTRDEVLSDLPNANGWSTCIEDCAGYGNGRHLAWLVARYDVTRKPEHAEQARSIFKGLCTLSTIRDVDTPFRAIVRGVLPDGKTYYVGKGPGPGRSTGDQYNGYSFAMWRYYHSPIPTNDEKEMIRSITHATYDRGGGTFAAMAGDITHNREFTERYETRKGPFIDKLAQQTATTNPSWTAVQQQLHYAALRTLDADPLCKRVFEHALRSNAWGRCKDLLAGLDFDPAKDDYLHRVNCVRNPLDGMLAVMLSEDREVIETLLPLYRVVLARYDFAAFRDSRQLTPFLGAYWLAVKQGFLHHDSALAEPDPNHVRLTALDPSHTPILTHFADCNPVAAGVTEDMKRSPGSPNWRATIDQADVEAREGRLTIQTKPEGGALFEAISEPWLRRVSSERGYSIDVRLAVPSGTFAISWEDGRSAEEMTITPGKMSLKNASVETENAAGQPADYSLTAKLHNIEIRKNGIMLMAAALKTPSDKRRLAWAARGDTQCEVSSFRYTVSDRFKYPHSDAK